MTIEEGNAAERDRRTGFEQVQALARGEYPTSPMTRLIPFDTEMPREKGRLTFNATPDETHLNGFGVVHGGWAMTMLDNAMGLAAHSMAGAGEYCPSTETTVNFHDRICANGEALTITADVVGREGRVFLLKGAIITKAGKKLASGASKCLLIRPDLKD